MSTTYNCYRLIEDIRRGLNEYSTGYVTGSDATGKYDNDYLLSNINRAYRLIYSKLVNRIQYEFIAETTLTGVASVFTLPADFGSLVLFRDDYGEQVFPISQDARRDTTQTGSKRYYYRSGNTFVVDKAGVTATYTLIYIKKPRDLHFGQATAGAATSMTLATAAPEIVDFYNGMQVENITKDWVDTIDDYATTRVATISETAATNDWYGLIPEIPEVFQGLIVPKAIQLTKAEFPLSQEKPSAAEVSLWNTEFETLISTFTNTSRDWPIEEVFEDFSEAPYFGG